MNSYKHLLLALSLLFGITALNGMEEFNWEDGLNEAAGESAELEHTGTRGVTPSYDLAVNLAGFPAVFDAVTPPFYLFTKPLRRRNIIDTDFLQFPRYEIGENIFAYLFYNETSKAFYTSDKTSILNYVDMNLDWAIKVLADADYPALNVPDILSLFQHIKVQERRIGTMFRYTKPLNESWKFSAHCPLLYQEHNFFLNDKEVETIMQSVYFKDFEGDFMEFAKEHLISDKIGIGDTRITFEKTLKDTYLQESSYGFDFTLPTAFAFAKGIIGNHFDKKKPRPATDNLIDDIFCLLEDVDNDGTLTASLQQAKQNLINFGNTMIDRLSTIILENPLGNDRHIGVGLFYRNKMLFSPTAALTSKTKMELLLPWQERRFIRRVVSQSEVDAIETAINALALDDNVGGSRELNNFVDLMLQKFFPESYKTTVFPGLVLENTTQFEYETDRFTWYIGNDTWYQTKEKLWNIQADETIKSDLETSIAFKDHALQNRLWVGVDRHHWEGDNWDLGLRLSITTFSFGVGGDFTFSFKFSHEF